MKFKLLFFGFLLTLGFSCVNSELLPVDYLPIDQPEEIVSSSLFIHVIEVDGAPVVEAVVQLGDQIYLTDMFGTCFVQDVEMSARAYFTVSKFGFFNGSRRLYVSEGKIQYARIVLLTDQEVGSFSASAGGHIEIDPSSSLVFPADAIVLEDGTPYTGEVHINGYTIHGDDPDLSDKMPGRLEGRYLNGEQGVLASYGMMAVEMHTSSGEELKVKDGQRVALRIDVPEMMRGGAPQEIPMWYFDEEIGEWQQEGFAQFNGTMYEAQVSHFTIWNCDEWNQSVLWTANFVGESGAPLANMKVCVTVVNRMTTACENSDEFGLVKANLPANEIVEVKVYGDCGTVLYSKNIGPFTNDAYGGAITMAFSTGSEFLSSVSGFGLDCNDLPIKKGLAIVTHHAQHYVSIINPSDGSFHHNFVSCATGNARVSVYDQKTLKNSEPKQLVVAENMDAGTLKACDEVDTYLNLNFQGFEGQYIFHHPTASYSPVEKRIYVDATDGSPDGMFFRFDFACQNGGNCPAGSWGAKVTLPNGQVVFLATLNLSITEFGPIGGAVTGNISGVFYGGGNGQGGPGDTNFNGKFSVQRTE